MSIAEVISTAPQRRAVAVPPTATPAKFPTIEPGQLWLVEASADAEPSAPLRHALDGANVVVYDRALAGALSDTLPLGTYAEAAADGETSLPRCVRFARDGWSVVRLLAAPGTQRERVAGARSLAARVAGDRPAGEVAITVIGELRDGICEPSRTSLDRLDLVVVTYPQDARLTVIVDGVGSAARVQSVAGNGLAG